jgi:putative tRNA adenosine deaminase-associated protein
MREGPGSARLRHGWEVAVPEDTLVDFAVVAFREDGQWQIGSLPHRAAAEMSALVAAVRQQPSEGATLALCSYGDDFFLVLRPDGEDMRVLVSDVTAVGEWPIAREALDLVGEPLPEGDDFEHVAPAGDLEIFADLGLGSMELAAICSDLELYPDEMLGQIAARIGFGPQFDRALEDDLT